MKQLAKTNIVLLFCALLTACGQTTQATSLPTNTAVPSQTQAVVVEPSLTQVDALSIPLPTVVFPDGTNVPFPTSKPKIPTYLPTLDPEQLPYLLRDNISVKTLSGVDGHTLKQITGWDYGFRKTYNCNSFQWLDSNHLILYPRTGEDHMPYGGGSTIRGDLSSQDAVINLSNGHLWTRPLAIKLSGEWGCNSMYWSQELGVIISQQRFGVGAGPAKEAVFVYTFDGQEVNYYWGKIDSVSPSGTKVLVDEDTVIDLRENKVTDLAWHMNYDLAGSSKLYWSSDETRLYRCCYYFADLRTGKSYNIEWSELRGPDGTTGSFSLHYPHVDGQWVRNDTYFFPKWDYYSYGGDPVVIFSPIEKKYYFVSVPRVPFINPETLLYIISPDGKYVWIKGYSEEDGAYHNFLVNVNTFETESYDTPVSDFVWSPNSQYGWTDGYESDNAYMLSVASKKLLPFPVNPQYEDDTATWHPKDSVLAYTPADDQSFALLNAANMTVQEWKFPVPVIRFYWSPTGDRMAFVSADGSLWQGEYPEFQNLEQLTEPVPGVRDVFWSPDGDAIAFVGGAEIFIVEVNK